jgi:cysteine desulfurase
LDIFHPFRRQGSLIRSFVKSAPAATLLPVAAIYLDHNATTPLAPEVHAAMLPYLGPEFGNPSSIHFRGRAARVAVDHARADLASVLGCRPAEIIFTSGGTESCNLAVLGAALAGWPQRNHLVVSAIEHPAVLGPARWLSRRWGFSVTVCPVDSAGRVRLDRLADSLSAQTALVSIMAANNEVGTIQPFAEISRLCADAGIPFHSDASQWFGKLPLPSLPLFGASLITLCAHKFGGPKGAGALVVRSGTRLEPLITGGSQEGERRAGTENVAAIVGLAAAAKGFIPNPLAARPALTPPAETLRAACADMPGVRLWSPPGEVLPNTVALSVAAADSLTLLAALDLAGVCASSGSACSVGSLEPSHVLLAMGATAAEARSLVRFSLGRDTTWDDASRAASILGAVINTVSNA